MIVVDGVGGHEGGEIATEIPVTEIPKYLKEYPFGERLTLLNRLLLTQTMLFLIRESDDRDILI